jgi:hypothetical protein
MEKLSVLLATLFVEVLEAIAYPPTSSFNAPVLALQKLLGVNVMDWFAVMALSETV